MPPVILVVAEVAEGTLTRLSVEVGTLARQLAAGAGGTAIGLVVDPSPDGAAGELAGYLTRVVAVTSAAAASETWAPHAVSEVRRLVEEGVTHVLLPATTEGRDVAGALVGLLGWGVLANASGVTWDGDGPAVRATVLGGKAITTSVFAAGTGIVTVAPGATTAEAGTARGVIESRAATGASLPGVAVVDRVAEAGAEASLEEARVVVVGGRGVGGPEGFAVVEDLASLLGGVVGATRASVDAGWIAYARQIGQTVLYLGLGVSGAMQHRVGMQSAEVIVAVNRDPDAPIAEVADLFVVGDLFAVGPALAAEVRARRAG